ncbi:MAG TPA: HEAT repeat domain-containing protein, partial [bacterium]|nr:HEAT repeat domain-containing protein [bacterium]
HLAVGDYAEIDAANIELAKLIESLQGAETKEEVEAQLERLNELIKPDGILYEAFQAAEMDGTEQVIGLVQTVAMILGTAQATRGASLAVEGAEAVFLADKMLRGFFWGAYIATAENAVATTTGEVRTERDTIETWVKDAVSTGASMALVMPAAGSVGQALEGNTLRNLATRYLNPGGLTRLAGDTALETLEETVDQQLRKTLDGKANALSPSEIKELFKLCLAGGGFQIGALAKNFQGQVEAKTLEKTAEEKEPASRRNPLLNPIFAPMWMMMGVDGLGGSGKEDSEGTVEGEVVEAKDYRSPSPVAVEEGIGSLNQAKIRLALIESHAAEALRLKPDDQRRASTALSLLKLAKKTPFPLDWFGTLVSRKSKGSDHPSNKVSDAEILGPFALVKALELIAGSALSFEQRIDCLEAFDLLQEKLTRQLDLSKLNFYLKAGGSLASVLAMPEIAIMLLPIELARYYFMPSYLLGGWAWLNSVIKQYPIEKKRWDEIESTFLSWVLEKREIIEGKSFDPRFRVLDLIPSTDASDKVKLEAKAEAEAVEVDSELFTGKIKKTKLDGPLGFFLTAGAGLATLLGASEAHAAAEAASQAASSGGIWPLAAGLASLALGIVFGSGSSKPTAPPEPYRERRKKLLDGLVRLNRPGQEEELVARVLEHSVEDGLELAGRLNLNPAQLKNTITTPAFVLKHPELYRKLVAQLQIWSKNKPEVENFIRLARRLIGWLPGPENQAELFPGYLPKKLMKPPRHRSLGPAFAAVDDFYLDAFITRKPLPHATSSASAADSESPGRRMARRYLEELEPLFEGKATAFRQIQEVKQAVVEQELKAELKQAHPEMRVELDAETDRYRLVAKEAEAADSKPDPVRQRLEAFEARAVEELERLLDQGSEGGYIAKGLAGLDSKAAWDLRTRLLDEGRTTKSVVVMGLAGLDSPQAWEMRESFLSEVESKIESERGDPTPAALSLAGLDSPRAWEMRERILSQGGSQGSVAAGLSGLDSRQAWDLRRRLLVEGAAPNLVALGLAGLDSPEAWDMRKHFQSLAMANDDKSTLTHLMESLAGLDSPQAWKMRHETLNISLGRPTGYLLMGSIAKGLAGLDSPPAWEMRLGLLVMARKTNNSFLKEDIAQSLAGLDSPKAWEMRRELFREIDGKHAVAEGITGNYTNFVWRLRPEWRVEPTEGQKTSVSERLAAFESRAAEELHRLLDLGAKASKVAQSLAGMDNTEAWAIRVRLLTKALRVKDDDLLGYIILGLAGVDSEEAWTARENLFQQADRKAGLAWQHGLLAQGLAGLDTDRAWAMRDRLLDIALQGQRLKLLDDIAAGLAGLDSKRAWIMREKLLKEGVSEIDVVRGVAGLDSERAWKVRQNLGYEDKNHFLSVAESLIGLDSERAWTLRDRFWESATLKNDILLKTELVVSLAGLDSPQAWNRREELWRELDKTGHLGLKDHIARSLAGLDSKRAQEMRSRLANEIDVNALVESFAGDHKTFLWRFLPEWQENEGLNLLNLVHRPSLPEIQKYLDRETVGDETGPKQRAGGSLGSSPQVARILTDFSSMDRDTARELLKTNPAVPDRAPAQLAKLLIQHLFPGLLKPAPAQGLPPPSLADVFRAREAFILAGGGAPLIQDQRPLLQSREAMEAFLVDGIYGRLDPQSQNWEKTELPIRREVAEPAQEATLTMVEVRGAGKISLPIPHDGRLLPERVRGVDGKGREIPLSPGIEGLGESVVKLPAGVVKLLYSVQRSTRPEPMRDPSATEFSAFLRGLDPKLRRDLTAPLPGLPQDLIAELRRPEFTALSPKEKVVYIETMVRELGWYDAANQEVSAEKAGKSPAEQILLAERRMEELRRRDPSIPDSKRFAGVCTDFTLLTVALLREAGIPAGILTGVNLRGQEAQMRNRHATAFVPWPEAKGGLRIVPVDGTPGGSDEEFAARPSLAEFEARARENPAAPDGQKTEAEVAELRKQAKAESVESILQLKNGELERAVNLILHHEVKEAHVQAVRRALEAFWYSGVDRGGESFESESEFLREEVARERLLTPQEATEQPGGAPFLAMVRDFVERFRRDPAIDSERKALDLLKSVARQADSGMNGVERRALAAVLSYLGAESMSGAKSFGGSGAGSALSLAVGVGAGLATLLGASEAQAAVAAVSEIGQGGLSGLGGGLAAFALGGIFHWLADRLKKKPAEAFNDADTTESLILPAPKGGSPYRDGARKKVPDSEIQNLIAGLADDSSEIRESSANALLAIGTDAVPALVDLLSHENSSFRYQSVILLQKLEVTQLANRFWEILDQGEEEGYIRRAVADALIQGRQIKGIDELRRLLQDRDAVIQIKAILAACDWEMREAIPDLWQLIKHEHGLVRFITALALDRFGEFKTMEDLQTILHDEVCADIASRVLARLGGIGEIEHFRKFLKHEKFYVRQQALIGFIK